MTRGVTVCVYELEHSFVRDFKMLVSYWLVDSVDYLK